MYTVRGSYKDSEPLAGNACSNASYIHNLKRLKVWAMLTIFGVGTLYAILYM